MIRCRLLYALSLLGAVLFHILYTGYFSWYVLVLVIIFPFFSLAVSLPGMLCCSVGLEVQYPRVRRKERVSCAVRFTCRGGLPVSRAKVRLEGRNLFTGEVFRFRTSFSGGAASRFRVERDCPHCGCVTFALKSLWVSDLLGLFSIPRRLGRSVEALVLPTALPEEPAAELVDRRGEGSGPTPRPGGGPGEDYDLRPYRPGDPMRNVHWKLSSKLDELVVRETLESREPVYLLTLDRFGSVAELDGVLSHLEAVSRWLLEEKLPHYVQWQELGEERPRQCYIDDEAGLYRCLRAICAAPVPLKGRSMLDVPLQVLGTDGPIRRLHLLPEERGEEGGR